LKKIKEDVGRTMRQIWLWGAGKYLEKIKEVVIDEKKIAGIIDNSVQLHGMTISGIPVYNPKDIEVNCDDVIIIASYRQYDEIRKEAETIYNIPKKNILCFFDVSANIKKFANDIDPFRWNIINEIISLTQKTEILMHELHNFKYEILAINDKDRIEYPHIGSKKEVLYKIIAEGKSMCRFGDGEMEMIFERKRPVFQVPDKKLGERLREVLESNDEKILICIANNYGSLDEFTYDAASAIRCYLTEEKRREQMQLLDMNKKYYDAYVSRPYILYKDKENAAELFALWKRVWKDRDILLIEGNVTRNGYGNDLFQNAKSLKRLLAPNENAWAYYAQIRQYILEHINKDTLLLISLGPAATVMAYDLANDGYQAIDIGHLDNEYEWFLRHCMERINISYKYVGEVFGGDVVENINDSVYEQQILMRIGC